MEQQANQNDLTTKTVRYRVKIGVAAFGRERADITERRRSAPTDAMRETCARTPLK